MILSRSSWSAGMTSRTSTRAIPYQPMARPQKLAERPVSLLAQNCSRFSSQAW